MKIIVIIPAHNEQENIANVINGIKKHASDIDHIVINDCSTDNTRDVLESIDAQYINLSANLGIGGGVQTGYIYARENNYDIAIQLDGDGQHDPVYIKELLKPILIGEADVVIGSRFIEKKGFQSSHARRAGIGFLSFLINLCCGVKIKDTTSGYRAVNRKLIEIFAKQYAQDYPEPEAIISSALNGAKIVEIPVVMKERQGGVSSISAFRSIYYMCKVSISIIIYRMAFNKNKVSRK